MSVKPIVIHPISENKSESFALRWLLKTIGWTIWDCGGVGGAGLLDGANNRKKSGLSEVRKGTEATGCFLDP